MTLASSQHLLEPVVIFYRNARSIGPAYAVRDNDPSLSPCKWQLLGYLARTEVVYKIGDRFNQVIVAETIREKL
jgi:hypothetical protein